MRPVRVLAIPAGHAYARHLLPVQGSADAGAPAVVHLPDPQVPREFRPQAGQWWPHQGLEPSWLREHAAEFDLVHLHFGFEHLTVERARGFVDTLGDLGKPLVLTVHDLSNPHLRDQSAHQALLDVLVPAADELFTLTPTAARAIRGRWDRAATVLAHPHVLPLDSFRDRPSRLPGAPVRVGVHLGAVRASTAGVDLLQPLLRAVRRLSTATRPMRLCVDLRPGAGDDRLADWLAEHAGEVVVHELAWEDDDALARRLETLDIAVLPYRWGTHSGWAEACRDAGVHVVAPDHGAYADQCPTAVYHLADEAVTETSLQAALSACLDAPPIDRKALRDKRIRERERLAIEHARRYAALVDPRVDVVIPWFCDQRALTRLLDALEQQTFAAQRMTVFIGDDGSPQPPVVGERPFEVVVRHQSRDGFRAAAARNRAAAAGTAPVVLFLDADMAPTSTYVQLMYAAVRETRGLVVGRRLHARLPDRPWVAPDGDDPPAGAELLDHPAWLEEGYAATDDLRDADERSYRFVISAVAGIDRAVFEQIGGFEESFRAYGGEDWELAHRAWIAGADLLHVRDAVAWHEGAEQGRRPEGSLDRTARKNAEMRAIAPLIPDPHLRHGALVWEHAHVAVLLDHAGDDSALIACAASLFASTDVALIVPAGTPLPPELAADPRVRTSYRRGRTPWEIHLSRPCILTCSVPAIIAAGAKSYRHRDLEAHVVDVRAAHRHTPRRTVEGLPPWVAARSLRHTPDLEAEWGWRR
ncbi:glycosyltransferase [Calidifontibacter sp. DB0510]|uniref:Glycosyltransferase n=1 Tax=Metallococcus carri TaxID=1656884 RepID=A0A967AWY6_9MICO|nr:glycosyltransferase [Metallococcus carri]NHN54509.1 glycosyltransferase [Metallococcus carri]NOP36652.1 glycosyltransferase [Calidifontibacter sp. DB2511S]